MVFINKLIRKNEHAYSEDHHSACSRPCVEASQYIAGSMEPSKGPKERGQEKIEERSREFARSFRALSRKFGIVHYLVSVETGEGDGGALKAGCWVSQVWHTRGRRFRKDTFPLAKQL